MTDRERLLVVCEAWKSVFSRINIRDRFEIATDEEVKAIDTALPILNPICTGDTAASFDVADLEEVLIAVLLAEGNENGRD